LDKFRFEQTENKIYNQATGFNAQAYKDDPSHNMQAFKYEVVVF
jgi:hypothetical protein